MYIDIAERRKGLPISYHTLILIICISFALILIANTIIFSVLYFQGEILEDVNFDIFGIAAS